MNPSWGGEELNEWQWSKRVKGRREQERDNKTLLEKRNTKRHRQRRFLMVAYGGTQRLWKRGGGEGPSQERE